MSDFSDRFALEYDADTYRRIVGGQEVILHCHHYNSRLQRTVEGADGIDGKAIVRQTAEHVFSQHVRRVCRPGDDEPGRLEVAAALYRHLGFGDLDFSALSRGVVTAPSSHYVEGWIAGHRQRKTPVCTFTEGYLQGAIHAATGRVVDVRETHCMIEGHEQCRFTVADADRPLSSFPSFDFTFTPANMSDFVHSESVDERAIIDALVAMPIHGAEEGLIPAFGVYLANMPADFYNIMCHTFVAEMAEQGKLKTARRLLISDAETCGMNTFSGIMASAEWDALIAPMITKRSDRLFGLIAVSNALGWGNWHVTEHTPGESLEVVSLNGYEALGYRHLYGETAQNPLCFMLTGVACGVMELLYSYGSLDERYGTFFSEEEQCICCGSEHCSFMVEAA